MAEYDFVHEYLEEYICQVCMKILKEPQLTDCCGKHFCRACLERWFQEKGKQQCPHCRSETFVYIIYLPLQRRINNLVVFCSNKKEGCNKTMELQELQAHLSTATSNTNGCGYVSIECENHCGTKSMLRKHLTDHYKECPQRKVECKYCKKVGPHSNISGGHIETCPEYPIDCPRGCRCGNPGPKVKRKDLEEHKSVCPLEPVVCPRKCGTVKRKDLKEHKKVCPLEPVKCPNWCGTVRDLKRKDLESHKELCPLEPMECPRSCGTVKRKNLESHKDVCPLEPVDCPRMCGTVRDLKREDLEAHEEVCPLEPVECPFHKAGCEQALVRKDLEEHLKSNTQQHLSNLKIAHDRLTEEHERLQYEHKRLQYEHKRQQDKYDYNERHYYYQDEMTHAIGSAVSALNFEDEMEMVTSLRKIANQKVKATREMVETLQTMADRTGNRHIHEMSSRLFSKLRYIGESDDEVF